MKEPTVGDLPGGVDLAFSAAPRYALEWLAKGSPGGWIVPDAEGFLDDSLAPGFGTQYAARLLRERG